MSLKPTYAIVAPAKIRPNSDYHVSLEFANTTKPVDIEVEVSGEQNSQPVNCVSSKICVNPCESSSFLNLKIGEWQDCESYKMTVKGKSDELEFKDEKKLKFEPKSCSIFVQTDKAIYKPGQSVKFRAIVVNSSLIPIVSSTLDVHDPKNNLIKQWKQVSTQLGVFSEQIQLSEQPPLGNWSISVETHGQKYSKEFTVAEYVLPTFSVDVQIPSYVTYSESEVVATVKANYTYGKPVKGECTLTVQAGSVPSYKFFVDKQVKFQIQTKIADDGVVEIPINLTKNLNLASCFVSQQIEFHASVKEDLTGKQNSSSSVLEIYRKDTKVELVKTSQSKTCKPGFKYTAFLKVTYQDDKPVEDNGPPVTLKYSFVCHTESDFTRSWRCFTHTDLVELTLVPVKGIVRVELNPPKNINPNKYASIEWTSEYRGKTYDLPSVENAQSPSNSFIQVRVKKDQATLEHLFGKNLTSVGEQVTFQVIGSEPMAEIVYKVISKEDIILASTFKTNDQTSSTIEFTVQITKQMAPKARLLVYYVREQNHEIVADALNFNVDGFFGTPVEMSSNVSETEPGGQVDITVQTQPSAYVGLLGVDQSISLLKSGNDLTREAVLQDLKSYDSGRGIRGRSIRPLYCSGSSSAIFDYCGLVIFTNALVCRKKTDNSNADFFKHEILGRWEYRSCRAFVQQASKVAIDGESPIPVAPMKLRQKFPETWIWADVTAGLDGLAQYSDKIPDTITSWIISAFAIDSATGLGVAEKNLKINVFRPFFAQLSLPYSIIRGELVEIKVLVFNYQNKPVQAEVVMSNAKNEFKFVNDATQQKQIEAHKRHISVGPFDGSSACFTITPTKIGHIDIRVSATCDNAGDALVKKLLVKPEGQTQYFNKAMFIALDANSSETVKGTFTIEIPHNAVPESTKVSVSGVSDILGPTVNHIDDLLRMPYGCGEQNMINFVPNIVALKYLTLVNRLTGAIKAKALANISTGYQRELTYRRDDGSFSAFGNSDRAGSTWLTAFVVKSFIQARPYLDMDQSVIGKAIEWLFSQQIENGSFVEKGEVHHKALQGGAAVSQETGFEKPETSTDNSAAALTAYVLIAILHEDKSNSVRISNEEKITAAENYIYSRLTVSNNPYEVSLISHALHLTDSQYKEAAYQKLMKLVKKDEDSLAYWTTKMDEKDIPESTVNFVDVESTAYALLTLVARSDTDNAISSLRWLISKQNSNGGFASTQDTVIGLQALGAIAAIMCTSTPQMSVSVKHGRNGETKHKANHEAQVITFDAHNALVLQQLQLEPDTEWVELDASGCGTAIVQVSHQYNIAEVALKPAFFLKSQVDQSSTENLLLLNIQTYYTNGDSTNMTVLEVELPSGYTVDLEAVLNAKNRNETIKRVETGNNEGTVFVYFDRVTKESISLTVAANRSHRVENNKPVPITIYDYCDRNQMSRIFYEPKIEL